MVDSGWNLHRQISVRHDAHRCDLDGWAQVHLEDVSTAPHQDLPLVGVEAETLDRRPEGQARPRGQGPLLPLRSRAGDYRSYHRLMPVLQRGLVLRPPTTAAGNISNVASLVARRPVAVQWRSMKRHGQSLRISFLAALEGTECEMLLGIFVNGC